MTYRIAICAGLLALGAGGATSAQAQFYEGPRGYYRAPMYDSGIPTGEVLMIVRAAGLRPLTQPARRGPRYVLLASDQMGGQLRVLVSAYDGRILQVSPAYDPRFAYQPARPQGMVPVPAPYGTPATPHPRYGMTGPEVKDPPASMPGSRMPAQGSRNPAVPPRAGATPDERIANAPPANDPTPRRPARTPLPRPRPATAANEATPPASVPAPVAATPQPATPAQAPATPAPTAASKPPAAPTELVPVAPLE